MIYGLNGTIHQTEQLDVEVYKGKVVAVWFRCAMLPFEQFNVDKDRAQEMATAELNPMVGVIFKDSLTRLD